MTRAGDAAVQADEVTSEVRLTPRSAYRAPKRSYLLASERGLALAATRDEHSDNIVPIARANSVNRNIKHKHGCVSKAQSCWSTHRLDFKLGSVGIGTLRVVAS